MLKLLDQLQIKSISEELDEILRSNNRNIKNEFIFDYDNPNYYLISYVFIESLIKRLKLMTKKVN